MTAMTRKRVVAKHAPSLQISLDAPTQSRVVAATAAKAEKSNVESKSPLVGVVS